MHLLPKEDSYLREKVLLVKNQQSAYVSALTKIVNKITRYTTENFDVSKLWKYESKLENAIQNIHYFSAKLKNLVKNEREIENILDFCTQQEFQVIEIKKSLQNYQIGNNYLNLQHLLKTPCKPSISKS